MTKLAVPDELHRFPVFLPDNKHFLYLTNNGKPETNGINVGPLDGSPSLHLLSDESAAAYAPPQAPGEDGYLLFRREGTLMGMPFDPGRLRATGDVFPIAEDIGVFSHANSSAFSVSSSGVLAYSTGWAAGSGQNREMIWMDRAGKRLAGVGQPGPISNITLSPDEKRISFSLINAAGNAADIWILDVQRGVPARFTFRPGVSIAGIWSPDGSSIVFDSDNHSIYRKPANGTGKEELLASGSINNRPLDWSRDGKFIVYQSYGGATGTDLFLLPMQGDQKPVPYLQTPFNEGDAQFSPDGRWMAYASNESGQTQVYVQAIPASGAKWQISPAGGDQPMWRSDGKELYYISTDHKLMAVSIKNDSAFEAGAPQPLFELDPIFPPFFGGFVYQPAANGQKFLVLERVGGEVAQPITVVLNWQAGLKK